MKRLGDREGLRQQGRRTDVLFFIAISPTKIGGIELFAQHLAQALARRGLTITYCFSTPPSDAVRRLMDSVNAQLVDFAEQSGFALRSAWALGKLIRSVRPETVVYSFGGILRPLPWLCRLAGAKRVVYNDHASRVPDDARGSAAKRFAARLITRPVSCVVGVSEFVAASSRLEGLHNSPVLAIPNGIDLSRRGLSASRAEFLARYEIPAGRRIVSQLSWLVAEKGVDTFLMAAAGVLKERSDVHFVVGGEGAQRAAYEQLARELRISGNVTFTGQLADPVASGFYPATDVFCLASRWGEACGLVLLEAMSMGTPVVASRVGGIPEYVRDGIDGLLVSSDATEDTSAFSKAILTLLQDDERRRRMGAAARQSVEENFDVRVMAERYADLLDGSGGAREECSSAGRLAAR